MKTTLLRPVALLTPYTFDVFSGRESTGLVKLVWTSEMNTHQEEVLGLLRNGGQEGIDEGCACLDRPQFPEIERRIQRLLGSWVSDLVS